MGIRTWNKNCCITRMLASRSGSLPNTMVNPSRQGMHRLIATLTLKGVRAPNYAPPPWISEGARNRNNRQYYFVPRHPPLSLIIIT